MPRSPLALLPVSLLRFRLTVCHKKHALLPLEAR
jgi:hypothetical protein